MNGKIYIIKNTINDKVYIGQTIKELNIRFTNHKMASRREDTKFYRAIRKYGEDKFYIELLEEVDLNLLNEREQYWINYYDSYENGYNSTLGGDGIRTKNYEDIINCWNKGFNLTQISNLLKIDRTTISNILKKQYNISDEKIKDRGYTSNHTLTDKLILKLWSEGLTPNQMVKKYGGTLYTIKKVLNKYNITNENIKERVDENQRNYSNEQIKELWLKNYTIGKIKEITGSNFDTIKKQLLKTGITQQDIDERRWKNTCQNKKQVIQKNLEGQIINIFESAAEASRINNIPAYGIRDCCNKKRKDYKGFKWEYDLKNDKTL